MSEDPLEDLKAWIQEKSVPSYSFISDSLSKEKGFLPKDVVESYFQQNNCVVTTTLLRRVFRNQQIVPVSARSVADRCCRGMCILVLIGRPDLIQTFVTHASLWDVKLPFERNSKPEDFPELGNEGLYARFIEHQWRFFAPVMENTNALHIKDECILPFIRGEQINPNEGTSPVYEVFIHPNHDNLTDESSSHCYALKCFRGSNAQRNFDRETAAFMNITGAQSRTRPGIIGFYQGFQYCNTFNILLERANERSLENFFTNKSNPSSGPAILDFWTSLLGIVKGLYFLHQIWPSDGDDRSTRGPLLQGWHQDLKPANVLVLSKQTDDGNEYTFKISDLGLSHFTTILEHGTDAMNLGRFGTRTYGAPECLGVSDFTLFERRQVTYSVDIWSLGCILAETCIWVVDGWRGLQNFRRARKDATDAILNFHGGDCFHNGVTVLPVVKSMLRALGQKYHGRQDFVTGKVVELVLDMLQPDPTLDIRPRAAMVQNKVERILEEAENELSQYERGKAESAENRRLPELNIHTAFQGRESTDVSGSVGPARDSTYSSTSRPRSGVQDTDTISASHTGRVMDNMDLQQSPGPIENIPVLTMSELNDFIRDKKRGIKTWMNLPNYHLLRSLKNRDQIFVVDDSQTMRPHREDVEKHVTSLAYLTKECDPDKMELYFLGHSDRIAAKNSSKLGDAVRRTTFQGTTDLARLGDILQNHGREVEDYHHRPQHLGLFSRTSPRKKSIYVFTDGKLEMGHHHQGHEAIKTIIQKIHQAGLHEQLGIQFISFGDDYDGLQRLRSLDRLNIEANLPIDAVDTEPANSNVWKMLLGGFKPRFDRDSISLDITSPSTRP